MAGISITLGGNFAVLNQLQAKVAETAAKIRDGFAERIGHRMFDGLIASAGTVARRLPEAIKLSIDAASDLNETLSQTSAIFGSGTDAILDWSKNSADALGLSRQEALAAASDFGGMFRVMGLGQGQVSSMSTRLVELAADLASFRNTSVPEAIQSIGAALRGEAEPIRKYNVLLNDATLKSEAMARGLSNGKSALDPTTKALAAYSAILSQTTDAQGDFARTSDGLANSQRQISARLRDLTAAVGQEFLPAAEQFVGWLESINVETAANTVGGLTQMISDLASAMLKFQATNPIARPGNIIAEKLVGELAALGAESREESERRRNAEDALRSEKLLKATELQAAADAYGKARDSFQKGMSAADKARFESLSIEDRIKELTAAEAALRETFNASIRTNFPEASGSEIAEAIQAQEKRSGPSQAAAESLAIAAELIELEQRRAKLEAEAAKASDEAAKKRADAVAEYDAELAMIRAKIDGNETLIAQLEREAMIRAKIGELVSAGVSPAEASARAEQMATAREEQLRAEKRKEDAAALETAKRIAAGSAEERIESNEGFLDRLRDIRSQFDSLALRPGVTAVDSMQRIGGGGGFAGSDAMLDYQRRQTDHLREMHHTLLRMESQGSKADLD